MRNAIKKDVLFFGLPAIVTFFLGLVVSARDGYDGLLGALWDLVRQPRSVSQVPVPNLVGLALFVGGLSVAIIGAITLRRFYASTLVIRPDHRLITHGLYRFVRHPIYLGVLMAVMGVPVYAWSLAGSLVMAVLIPIFLNRIRMEENLLTEEFGDAYRKYQQETSKLIPFIY